MNPEPFQIVIVGGGTAGWLTAAFLHRQLPLKLNRPVAIALIEAQGIPTIGVGEATIPSIRNTLAACGIEEHVFLKECSATFKHGIEFVNWRRLPAPGERDAYFHPFGDQLQVAGHDATWQWLRLPPDQRPDYADAFSVQREVAKQARAPKNFRDAPYAGALAYAYHLDAGKLADFLKRRCRAAGVAHVVAKVEAVDAAGDDIRALSLDNGTAITADLFIDCTGFAARLVNHDRANPFHSLSDVLFVDRAVTTRVPIADVTQIAAYTRCTAQGSGWIWDISLQDRRGVGHVYSARHTSDDAARAALAAYLGQPESALETRQLTMRIGYHQQQWRGNCVAVGLASGFLEPLESTGIYLTEMANWALLDLLPRYAAGGAPQGRHDDVMHHHYRNIADFLKLHYCLSQRRDTAFWRDNCDPATIPQSLHKLLQSWRDAVPSLYDFDRKAQCFSETNFKFVLYGMGWPECGQRPGMAPQTGAEAATALLTELAQRRAKLMAFVLRDTVPVADYFSALRQI